MKVKHTSDITLEIFIAHSASEKARENVEAFEKCGRYDDLKTGLNYYIETEFDGVIDEVDLNGLLESKKRIFYALFIDQWTETIEDVYEYTMKGIENLRNDFLKRTEGKSVEYKRAIWEVEYEEEMNEAIAWKELLEELKGEQR